MDFSVLVVCSANVCRSPAAAAVLADRLATSEARVNLASAGAGRLSFGLQRCEQASAWVLGSTGAALPPERSQPVTTDLIDGADLVLTAARRHRGAVIALRPRARVRVFTLREAAALSTGLPPHVLRGPVTAERMRLVVEELDALRGVAGAPRDGALDVPDAHDGLVPHEAVFDVLDRSVRAVVTALTGPAVG